MTPVTVSTSLGAGPSVSAAGAAKRGSVSSQVALNDDSVAQEYDPMHRSCDSSLQRSIRKYITNLAADCTETDRHKPLQTLRRVSERDDGDFSALDRLVISFMFRLLFLRADLNGSNKVQGKRQELTSNLKLHNTDTARRSANVSTNCTNHYSNKVDLSDEAPCSKTLLDFNELLSIQDLKTEHDVNCRTDSHVDTSNVSDRRSEVGNDEKLDEELYAELRHCVTNADEAALRKFLQGFPFDDNAGTYLPSDEMNSNDRSDSARNLGRRSLGDTLQPSLPCKDEFYEAATHAIPLKNVSTTAVENSPCLEQFASVNDAKTKDFLSSLKWLACFRSSDKLLTGDKMTSDQQPSYVSSDVLRINDVDLSLLDTTSGGPRQQDSLNCDSGALESCSSIRSTMMSIQSELETERRPDNEFLETSECENSKYEGTAVSSTRVVIINVEHIDGDSLNVDSFNMNPGFLNSRGNRTLPTSISNSQHPKTICEGGSKLAIKKDGGVWVCSPSKIHGNSSEHSSGYSSCNNDESSETSGINSNAGFRSHDGAQSTGNSSSSNSSSGYTSRNGIQYSENSYSATSCIPDNVNAIDRNSDGCSSRNSDAFDENQVSDCISCDSNGTTESNNSSTEIDVNLNCYYRNKNDTVSVNADCKKSLSRCHNVGLDNRDCASKSSVSGMNNNNVRNNYSKRTVCRAEESSASHRSRYLRNITKTKKILLDWIAGKNSCLLH
ncbi:hypothetical protein FHG87_022574 [Trinorchestia longiramus]|nr:hypothetical protein FHG87_022574 [Trinorchestia longiramus]